MKNITVAAGLMLAFAWCAPHPLSAQIINFSVASNYSGQGALSDPGHNFWNAIIQNGTTSNDLASDGVSSTAVTLTVTNSSFYYSNSGKPNGTSGFFFSPYFYTHSTATDTLNNVSAGTYNLYLYGDNSNFASDGVTFTVGTTSLNAINTTNSAFIVGNNYVEFTGLTLASTGSISFSMAPAPGHSEAAFNGLQLEAMPVVTAPEPSTYALLISGLGILAWVCRHRRQIDI
jgi:hypothetical protein